MITKYPYANDTIQSNRSNVIEYYRQWQTKEVRADLQKNRSDAVMIFQNVSYNINIACSIRSNNAFLGKEIYICGRRKYDSRACVGTNHFENVYHADNLKEVIDHCHSLGYTVYAIDNIMEYNPINLMDIHFPQKSAFVFGEENAGLSQEEIELCDGMIYIGMYGSVRSLNVSVASGIILYEYTRQWRQEIKWN